MLLDWMQLALLGWIIALGFWLWLKRRERIRIFGELGRNLGRHHAQVFRDIMERDKNERQEFAPAKCTVNLSQEFYLSGLRFRAGLYEITRVDDSQPPSF